MKDRNKKIIPFQKPLKNKPKKVETYSIKDVIEEIEEVQKVLKKIQQTNNKDKSED